MSATDVCCTMLRAVPHEDTPRALLVVTPPYLSLSLSPSLSLPAFFKATPTTKESTLITPFSRRTQMRTHTHTHTHTQSTLAWKHTQQLDRPCDLSNSVRHNVLSSPTKKRTIHRPIHYYASITPVQILHSMHSSIS